MDPWKGGTRLLEHKTVNEEFKLQRTVSGVNGHFVVQRTFGRSSGASFIGPTVVIWSMICPYTDMVARSIHIEAMEASIMLSAKYLAGTLNLRVDYISRVRSTYE